MASDAGGSIETFVALLEPNLVGRASLRRRLAEEMCGHLEDAAEHYRILGLTPGEAAQRAIEDFGPPEVVVGAWAESKGVGVPTTFTRYAGLAGIVGALGLGGSLIYEQMSESYSHGMFAEVSLSFLALFAMSLVALYLRVRGKLVPYGRLGTRVAIVGFVAVVVSSSLWFAPGALVGLLAIFVGLGSFFVGTIRSGVVPRGPLALGIAGLVGAFLVGLVGTLLGFDSGPTAALVGVGALATGWAWLGLHLWSEDVAADTDRELATG
ncbi:MAG TPA: permease prefix domain 1-containing protein [Actinomycetota bacterium]|nr:permease prefix domain 1-containing protein [Actinomycetota bacterium]